MDLAGRHHGIDGVERRHDAGRAIGVESEIAVSAVGLRHEIMNTVNPRSTR